jgi:hypothetical protein
MSTPIPSLADLTTFCTGLTVQHNGMLFSLVDLASIKQSIAAQHNPWYSAYNKLVASSFSSKTYPKSTPVASITTLGQGETGLAFDAVAAMGQILRGYFSDDTSYYTAAEAIIDGWSSTLVTIRTPLNWYLDAG